MLRALRVMFGGREDEDRGVGAVGPAPALTTVSIAAGSAGARGRCGTVHADFGCPGHSTSTRSPSRRTA